MDIIPIYPSCVLMMAAAALIALAVKAVLWALFPTKEKSKNDA